MEENTEGTVDIDYDRLNFFGDVERQMFELNYELFKMKEKKMDEELISHILYMPILSIEKECKIFLKKIREFDSIIDIHETIKEEDERKKELEESFKITEKMSKEADKRLNEGRNKRPNCCVYFIQQGEDGPIKIGISNKPFNRLNDLQSASPWELNLLKTTGYRREHLAKGDEALLHDYFEPLRMSGEWFKPDKKLIDFINNLEDEIKYLRNYYRYRYKAAKEIKIYKL